MNNYQKQLNITHDGSMVLLYMVINMDPIKIYPPIIAHRPRGLPGVQHSGCPVVEHDKRDCRKYCEKTQWFLV
jgi:hypothetical protein